MPGSHLYGSGSIGLGLAQVNPHLTALHNQSGLPPCMDSLISPSHPSAFRSPPSAAFFLSPPASNPDFGNEFGSDLFNAGSDQTAPPMMMMNHHFYNQVGCSMHSLFDTPAPNDSVLPQMSATALLQKAAQMGATSSTNSRNETHLQDIMNSFANGNSGIFSGGQQQEAKFGDFNVGFCGLDESNYHGNGLTRDFLGVGSLLRNLGGGVSSQREQQQNHGVVDVTESLNSEMKPASLCHSFAGGGRLR